MHAWLPLQHVLTILLFAHHGLGQIGLSGEPSITASPNPYVLDGQWVTVEWWGIKDPRPSDILAIVQTAPGEPHGPKDPLRFVWPLQIAADTHGKGYGSHRFYVSNHRHPLTILYLQNPPGPSKWSDLVAVAALELTPSTQLSKAPHQISMSYKPGGDERYTVQVTWQAGGTSGKVYYSTQRNAVESAVGNGAQAEVSHAMVDTFDASDMCARPANSTGFMDPGPIHTALLTGLRASTQYFYKVGSEFSGYSDVNSFLTPPSHEGEGQLNILVAADIGVHNNNDGTWMADGLTWEGEMEMWDYFGDPFYPGRLLHEIPLKVNGSTVLHPLPMPFPVSNFYWAASVFTEDAFKGIQPGSRWVHDGLNREASSGRYQAAIFLGDTTYAEGSMVQWDAFKEQLGTLLRSVPAMFASGNHESKDPGLPEFAFPPRNLGGWGISSSGGECGIVYEKKFRMPFANETDPEVTALRPEYYSYTMGPVHFVVLSTEQNLTKGSHQNRWLMRELHKVDRHKTPWLVFTFHRPMYLDRAELSAGSDQEIAQRLMESLEFILAEHQVDLVWTGHAHQYHRTCPVIKRNCVGYAEDGSAKGPVHVLMGNGGFPAAYFVYNETVPWIAKRTDGKPAESLEYGYCTTSFTRTTHNMQCYGAVTGKLIDSYNLTKPAGWMPNKQAARKFFDALPKVELPTGYVHKKAEKQLQKLLKELNMPTKRYLIEGLLPGIAGVYNSSDRCGQMMNSSPGQMPLTVEEKLHIVKPLWDLFDKEREGVLKKFKLREETVLLIEYVKGLLQPHSRLMKIVRHFDDEGVMVRHKPTDGRHAQANTY